MKTPFKISFKENLGNLPNKIVLENFKTNFENSYCDCLEIIDDKQLIIKNDFFRLKPDWNMNLWVGIGNAEIIIEDRIIKYSIDFTRMIFTYVLIALFSLFIIPYETTLYFTFSILIVLVGILSYTFTFLRHLSIFKRTLKYGIDKL